MNMGKIIEFNKKNEKEYTRETYQFLTNRLHDYIDFIVCHTPDKDRCMWCEKLIAVLKFLGDYKLDEELEDDFYLATKNENGQLIKINKSAAEVSNNYELPQCKFTDEELEGFIDKWNNIPFRQ